MKPLDDGKPRRSRHIGGQGPRRRGAVAALVAVMMTVVLGLAALVVDLSMLYNTRAELQRTADAAALSAAMQLADFTNGDPLVVARQTAQSSVNTNRVLNSAVELSQTDVVFGRAFCGNGNRYTFASTEDFPNAVQVSVRRTAGSASGAVPLFFANIFGIQRADVGARASAVLVPRDIAFVLDLSSSHNDDSSLRAFKKTTVYNKPIWEHLKDWPTALAPRTDSLGFNSQVNVVSNHDGTSTVTLSLTSDSSNQTSALSHLTLGLPSGAQAMAGTTATSSGNYPIEIGTDPTTGVSGVKYDETSLGENGVAETETFSFTMPDEYLDQTMLTVATKAGNGADTSVQYNLASGPTIGNLNTWGTESAPPSWDYSNDAGLVRLPKGSAWTVNSSFASQFMKTKGYGTYTSQEMSAINSSSGDSSTSSYRRRVRVALGIDRWKSGKNGGQSGGNGDNVIDANEVVNMVPYPGSASNPVTGSKKVGGNWDAWIDYVISSSSSMCKYDPANQYYGDSNLRYRFGLKTWLDYLQEDQEGTSASPGLDGAPVQPMAAVTDAVKTCLEIIDDLKGDDQVGMAAYGSVGYGPSDKPNNLSWLTQNTESLRTRANVLQAGMWTANTCMAQGIDKGVDVLTQSAAARNNAAKVMVLLTDGIANMSRSGQSASSSVAKADALAAAQDAVDDHGVRIFTISVGASADQDLMEDIARIGGGEHYHAEGEVETYRAQLQEIFQKLGGKRPVILFN